MDTARAMPLAPSDATTIQMSILGPANDEFIEAPAAIPPAMLRSTTDFGAFADAMQSEKSPAEAGPIFRPPNTGRLDNSRRHACRFPETTASHFRWRIGALCRAGPWSG